MKAFEKSHEGGCFRGTQILAIGRHVAAALNYLANELVLREPYRNGVKRRTSLSAGFSERMAVAALLDLEHQSALPLQGGRAMNELIRHEITTPRIHVRAPGRVSRQMSKRPERDRDQHHCQDRDGPPLPTLFTFARKKRKQKQSGNHHHRSNQKCRCFERGREQRKQSIQPQEKVIRFGNSLDDRGIGLAGWPKRTEVKRARGDCQDDKRREKHVFPNG